MPLFNLAEPVTLDGPILVASFDGWVDAGNAGTLAARQLLGDASRVVGTFDADQLFDYRARRPTLDIVDGTLQSLEWPELTLRAPGRLNAAALSVLELGVSQGGIPCVGFYAQVPHYLSAAYPQAAIELLSHVGRYLGYEPPLGELPMQALETRALLDAATAADERTKAHVERLEEMADQARLPVGDDLIADIERFLRDRGGGDRGDDGGGTRLN